MKKELAITTGAVALVAGVGYFAYRFIKETKRQIAEIKEQAELEKKDYEDQIANKNIQLEFMEENLSQLTEGTIDENWAIMEAQLSQENAELEEMRRKQARNIFSENPEAVDIESAPSEEEDYHAGAQQTAEEEIVHHNVWQENEYFNPGEADIPYFIIQSAKDLKGNEGQSLRHDADLNSVEAWNSYKAVMISELYDDGPTVANDTSNRYNLGILVTRSNIDAIIDRFSELLEVNDTKIVQPFNEYDNNVFEDVYERRQDFFGPDAYYSTTQFPVTFGEILYEYARKFIDDTEAGSALAFITYMLHEAGLLDAETIEQRLLIISKVMEHRNVQDLGQGMHKLGMFGRVVDQLSPEHTGREIRLYNEYNEFLSRATTFEEEWKEANGIDDDEDEYSYV
nr:MAG TPA: hypothetical protein [Caudoviricetes sp.]